MIVKLARNVPYLPTVLDQERKHITRMSRGYTELSLLIYLKNLVELVSKTNTLITLLDGSNLTLK